MIQVVLADDQELMLKGLTMILEQESDIQVVGRCQNGEEAIYVCKRREVDVVLMDIRMPHMNGVEATKAILDLEKGIKVIILTTFNEDAYIYECLTYGASGYLLKDATPEEIIASVRHAKEGHTHVAPQVVSKMIDMIGETGKTTTIEERPTTSLLTRREREICHYLAQGKNNGEIADLLSISEGTVKNHMTKILDKTMLRDRTQLALYALRHRL